MGRRHSSRHLCTANLRTRVLCFQHASPLYHRSNIRASSTLKTKFIIPFLPFSPPEPCATKFTRRSPIGFLRRSAPFPRLKRSLSSHPPPLRLPNPLAHPPSRLVALSSALLPLHALHVFHYHSRCCHRPRRHRRSSMGLEPLGSFRSY